VILIFSLIGSIRFVANQSISYEVRFIITLVFNLIILRKSYSLIALLINEFSFREFYQTSMGVPLRVRTKSPYV
jgi:NADH:ubiquinone oxidoreductase subunit H